jgi:hypothetical protein
MPSENLNKENFWDGLQVVCPDAVAYFCKWIDEYKKEVDWDDLFGNAPARQRVSYCSNIKFHHLPFEMQNGIIARFELELFNNKRGLGKEAYQQVAGNYKQQTWNLFKDLQRNIDNKRLELQSNDPAAQVSDTTGDDKSSVAGNIQ